jgi:hypothetical protein
LSEELLRDCPSPPMPLLDLPEIQSNAMRPDQRFRIFLRISSLIYGAAAAEAFWARAGIRRAKSRVHRKGQPVDSHWQPLGVAYLVTEAALSWVAAQDPTMSTRLTPPLLVSHGAAAALYLNQFRKTRRAPSAMGGLAGSALFGATAYLARAGRRYVWLESNLPAVRRLNVAG